MDPRFVAVIDIGKTNAKVALADLEAMAEIAVEKTPNLVLPGPPYPHFGTERLFSFILDGLANLAKEHRVDAISITTHGASAALTTADGALALPVLDYEHDGPDEVRADYEAIRPSFAETGSPPLPAGLNLGAQIFWQSKSFPNDFARVRHILMYPQYWAMRLTGVAASEVTSLGCHTDLWNPHDRDFSSLVAALTGNPALHGGPCSRHRVRPVIGSVRSGRSWLTKLACRRVSRSCAEFMTATPLSCPGLACRRNAFRSSRPAHGSFRWRLAERGRSSILRATR